MSQKSALWNLALSGLTAIGLLVALLALGARKYPMAFLPTAASICALGFACVVAAKVSLMQVGRRVSFGSRAMTLQRRQLYRLATNPEVLTKYIHEYILCE